MYFITTLFKLSSLLLIASVSAAYDNVMKIVGDHNVIVFSTKKCPWCVRAKDLLQSLDIDYHVVDLDSLPGNAGNELYLELKAATNQNTVPNIFIKGRHIGGFDSINKLNQAGLLKSYAGQNHNANYIQNQ